MARSLSTPAFSLWQALTQLLGIQQNITYLFVVGVFLFQVLCLNQYLLHKPTDECVLQHHNNIPYSFLISAFSNKHHPLFFGKNTPKKENKKLDKTCFTLDKCEFLPQIDTIVQQIG